MDAVDAEDTLVLAQPAPGGEVRAVRAEHDVVRLDLAHGWAAADVEVVDEDRRGVLDGADHGVGDRLVRRGERLHEQAHAVGQRARTGGGALGHRGDDLEQRRARVTGPRRVVEPPQPDRHRHQPRRE